MDSPSRLRGLVGMGAALALAAVVAMPATAQTTIGAGGGDFVQSWGKDNTQTYGQTITTPTDNVLTSFSFWLGRTSTNYPDPSNPSLSFMAYVYAWGGSMATGSALYSSGVVTHNATPETPFTKYTFTTGGLSLVPGNMYALFLSTSGLAGTGRIQWEASELEDYAGGNFIFMNNGENTADWTTTAWSSGFASDVRFEATFEGTGGPVVPEPATWIMMVTGLMALGLAAQRRRRDGIAEA